MGHPVQIFELKFFHSLNESKPDDLQVSGLEQFLAYKVGLVTGQFYEVLNDRDLDGFYRVVGVSTVIILCMVVVLSLRQFVTRSMIVGWRREGYTPRDMINPFLMS